MPENPNLSDKQWQTIDLLAQGMSKLNVAEVVGIDRSTVYRWLKDPDFVEALTKAVYDFMQSMRVERMQRASNIAKEALGELYTRVLDAEKRGAIATKDLKDLVDSMVKVIKVESGEVTNIMPKDPDGGDPEELDPDTLTRRMGDSDFRRGLLDLLKRSE